MCFYFFVFNPEIILYLTNTYIYIYITYLRKYLQDVHYSRLKTTIILNIFIHYSFVKACFRPRLLFVSRPLSFIRSYLRSTEGVHNSIIFSVMNTAERKIPFKSHYEFTTNVYRLFAYRTLFQMAIKLVFYLPNASAALARI